MSLEYVPVSDEEIILPWEAVNAAITKEDYRRDSRWFLEFGHFVDPKKIHHRPGPDFAAKQTYEETEKGMRKLVETFRKDPVLAKNMVISFIRQYNKRIEAKEIGTTETKHRLRPVRLACEMNEILLPWKKLWRLIAQGKTTKEDREYSLKEIRDMLAKTWIALKVVILFMSGSGIRVGAFDYLTVGNIRPVYRDGKGTIVPDTSDLPFKNGIYEIPKGAEALCGVMTVYSEEEGADYDTFLTREAYSAWISYVQLRGNEGQRIAKDSPAVVTRRSFVAGEDKSVRRWKSRSIANDVNSLLWRVGIRKEKKRRHEVQMDHGFRKWYDNVAKDHMLVTSVERLMGHDLGTSEHYDRHIPKPILEEYLHAMPFLSIDEAYRREAALTKRLEEIEKTKDEDLRKTQMTVVMLEEANKKLTAQVQELLRAGGLMKPEKLKEMVRELVLDASNIPAAERPSNLGKMSPDETVRVITKRRGKKP